MFKVGDKVRHKWSGEESTVIATTIGRGSGKERIALHNVYGIEYAEEYELVSPFSVKLHRFVASYGGLVKKAPDFTAPAQTWKEKIVHRIEGTTTHTAIVQYDGYGARRRVGRGSATLHPGDRFDVMTGRRVAAVRAYQDLIDQIRADVPFDFE